MNDQPILRATEKDILTWSSASSKYARHDYDSDDYRIAEMLNDEFFGHCHAVLRQGDFITIYDCENQIVTVRVDLIDKQVRKAYLSRIERLYAIPVVALKEELPDDPGLVYRNRSHRGGGHSIVTADGSVFAVNFANRTDAERAIANCYESKAFIPPHGHEPAEPYVSSNTKIYKPRV